MRKALLFLVISLLAVQLPAGNELTLSGTVKSQSGRPLAGVEVISYYKQSHYSAVSDRNGHYMISLPSPGNVTITYKYYVETDTTEKELPIKDNFTKDITVPDSVIYKTTVAGKIKRNYGKVNTLIPKPRRFDLPPGVEVEEMSKSPRPMVSAFATESEISPVDGSAGTKITTDYIEVVEERLEEKTVLGSASGFERQAGQLTSGEVNDFRKWGLWNDLSGDEFSQFSSKWKITPRHRYTVQLLTRDSRPNPDAEVHLLNSQRDTLWSARTDNTGKAELWQGIFNENEESGLSIVYDNKGNTIYADAEKFEDRINIIRSDSYCEMPGSMDILFAVDATGSMGDEIDYLKAELKDIITRAAEKSDLDIRLGSLFYRDIGDDILLEKSELSEVIDKTRDFINKQYARGGGDMPEAVDIALRSAVNEFEWSKKAIARIMFLILDAELHTKPENLARLRETTALASKMGIRIVPLACSGIEKNAEYLLRSLALATNGTYVFLTDDSGIGESHIKPSTDKYDVEFMNDLFVRIIEQFSTVPGCENEIDAEGIAGKILNKDENPFTDESLLKCWPNPCKGELNVEFMDGIEELFLTDIGGKILSRISYRSGGRELINLRDYPSGIYFLKYRSKDKWGTEKIVLLR
ncbi:MAG: carboxypeptidase regulatory-like domain-containing protein [Candidatus Kapaibacterium sp.]